MTDTAQALGVTAQAMLDSHTAAPDTGSATTVAMSAAGAVVSGSGAQAQQDGVVITAGGVYVLSGTLADGRIVVNAPKQQVTLVLQDAAITCSTGSPLYVYKAAGVTVWAAGGNAEQPDRRQQLYLRGCVFLRAGGGAECLPLFQGGSCDCRQWQPDGQCQL